MTDEDVMLELEEQLNDLRDVKRDEVFLLMKPEHATEAQWKAALDEVGVVSA